VCRFKIHYFTRIVLFCIHDSRTQFLCSDETSQARFNEIENSRRCLGRWYKSCAATVVKQQPSVEVQGLMYKEEYRTELSLKTSAATVDWTQERERKREIGTGTRAWFLELLSKLLCLSMSRLFRRNIFFSYNRRDSRLLVVVDPSKIWFYDYLISDVPLKFCRTLQIQLLASWFTLVFWIWLVSEFRW